MDVGTLLIRRGSVGNVIEVGTFLQDQVIFTVHFLNHGRMVGCRLEELIGADEPWNPSRFEFRDKVVCTIDLEYRVKSCLPKGPRERSLKSSGTAQTSNTMWLSRAGPCKSLRQL